MVNIWPWSGRYKNRQGKMVVGIAVVVRMMPCAYAYPMHSMFYIFWYDNRERSKSSTPFINRHLDAYIIPHFMLSPLNTDTSNKVHFIPRIYKIPKMADPLLGFPRITEVSDHEASWNPAGYQTRATLCILFHGHRSCYITRWPMQNCYQLE